MIPDLEQVNSRVRALPPVLDQERARRPITSEHSMEHGRQRRLPCSISPSGIRGDATVLRDCGDRNTITNGCCPFGARAPASN